MTTEPDRLPTIPGQAALWETQTHLLLRSRVFLLASDPIVLEDLAGSILDLNEAAVRAYEWSREELIGKSITTLIDPSYHERASQARARCLRQELMEEFPCVRVTKTGEQIPVTLSLFPIRDHSDQVRAIASIAKDLRELKRQEELRTAVRRAEERTEDRERRELARDLHDSVGQLLTLARIHLSELLDDTKLRKPRARIKDLGSIIEEIDKRVRTLMFRVNPSSLHELGFPAAAEELADDLTERYGLRVSIEDDKSTPSLDDDTRATLFRGLRELLINVARHARTDEARVRLETTDNDFVVTVVDDGVGFDPLHPTAGFGLLGIRDRLERCGGSLELESTPGDGTQARMTAPFSLPTEESP